jgi:regulator-associated protein of mTOR
MSPTSNGYGHSLADVTGRFSPADIVSYLIVKDLIKFSTRRRPETDDVGRERHLWEDFKIDEGQLSDIDELGLDAGASLLQILPLKSKLYDWALEYYKEPQMRVSGIIWSSKIGSLVSLAT